MDEFKELEELRKYLERKVNELEDELSRLRRYLDTLENLISEKTFSTAKEISRQGGETREKVVKEQSTPIQTKKPYRKEVIYTYRGRPIAWAEHYEKGIVILIDKEFGLNRDHSLITRFLENRLRGEMLKDMEEIEKGLRKPEDRFTFNIIDEDGVITRIEIRDNGEMHRRRDSIGKVRWVLKKYEEEKIRGEA